MHARVVLALGTWTAVCAMLRLVFCQQSSLCEWFAAQAMIMTDPSDKLDPMSLLFYMSSFSVMLLLPSTLILEPGVFGEVRPVHFHACHCWAPVLQQQCC